MKDRKKRQPEIEEFSYEGKYDYSYVDLSEEEAEAPQFPETIQDPEAFAARRKKQQNAILVSMLCIIAAILIGFIVIRQTVFRLSNVVVVGVGEEYHAEVVNNCGLLRGQDIFTVDSETVRTNLDRSNRIIFVNLTVELPNTVCIFVSEREKAAVIQWNGNNYELDSTGRVLGMVDSTVIPEGLPIVLGLDVDSAYVGSNISVSNQKKLTYLFELIAELKIQNFNHKVTEIFFVSSEEAYLTLTNGINVRLGNSEHLRAKVGAIIGSMNYCEQQGGNLTLNVTLPEKPTVLRDNYSPDSAD